MGKECVANYEKGIEGKIEITYLVMFVNAERTLHVVSET